MSRVVLKNGWTLSVVPELAPALWSVAAWPTANTDAPMKDQIWFRFADGSQDKRCFGLGDVAAAAREVVYAPPP